MKQTFLSLGPYSLINTNFWIVSTGSITEMVSVSKIRTLSMKQFSPFSAFCNSPKSLESFATNFQYIGRRERKGRQTITWHHIFSFLTRSNHVFAWWLVKTSHFSWLCIGSHVDLKPFLIPSCIWFHLRYV